MPISDRTTRLPGSKKNGKMNPRCKKCEEIPSAENCLKCFLNLLCMLNNNYYEDENLSVKEQIIKIKQDLDNLSPVPSLFIQIVEAYSDKKIKLERKLLELSSKVEIKVDDSSNIEEKEPKIVRKKIPINGKKRDIGQKIGLFFFNPKNKDGLQLPKIHVAEVIETFCESYKPIDSTEYSSRYLLDNVNAGANKDLEEEN